MKHLKRWVPYSITLLIVYICFSWTPNVSAFNYAFTTSGIYAGDGVDNRTITVGFQPDVVIIKSIDSSGAERAVISTSTMPAGKTKQFALPTTGLEDNLIESFTATGFVIGTDGRVNSAVRNYAWIAFKAHPDEMRTGSYVGNEQNGHVISGVGFQPSFLIIMPDSNNSAVAKGTAMAMTHYFFSDPGTATAILSFDNNGTNDNDSFTLGTSSNVNKANVTYHYIAWKNIPGRMKVSSYLGNSDGDDEQTIGTVGFRPEYLLIFPENNSWQDTLHKSDAYNTLAGDSTLFFGQGSEPDKIKQFLPNGFLAGGSARINGLNQTYFYVGFSQSTPSTFTQTAYRFFANGDTPEVGAAFEAQNTTATLSETGQAFRLRLLLGVASDQLYQNGENFKLQFVDKNGGSCDMPGGNGTPALYTDVTSSTILAFKDNLTPADGEALASSLEDPTDGGNATIHQTYEELNNFTNSIAAIPAGHNGEWDFSLYDNGAPANTTYCFRIVKANGTFLDLYSVYPEIITAVGDITPPTVIDVNSSTPDGVYGLNKSISIQIHFSEPVTVIGTPQLWLETGKNDTLVNYESGSGTDTLTFIYTVTPRQKNSDLDYVDSTSLILNGATITDDAGNNAILTLPNPSTPGSLSAAKNLKVSTGGGNTTSFAPTTGNDIAPSVTPDATNNIPDKFDEIPPLPPLELEPPQLAQSTQSTSSSNAEETITSVSNHGCDRNNTPLPFTDVTTHWIKPIAEIFYKKCVINGKTATSFNPDSIITRAELSRILTRYYKLEEQPYSKSFSDVTENDWFAKDVITVAAKEIIKGFQAAPPDNFIFKPNEPLTRAEVLGIIMGMKGIYSKGLTTTFADVPQNEWFYNNVAYAQTKGFIKGYKVEGTDHFKPYQGITRAEALQMIEVFEKMQ